MYIAPSSGHEWLNLKLPFKFILRSFEVVFWCLEWECCTFWKIDGNSFKSTNTILYYGFKDFPRYMYTYMYVHVSLFLRFQGWQTCMHVAVTESMWQIGKKFNRLTFLFHFRVEAINTLSLPHRSRNCHEIAPYHFISQTLPHVARCDGFMWRSDSGFSLMFQY